MDDLVKKLIKHIQNEGVVAGFVFKEDPIHSVNNPQDGSTVLDVVGGISDDYYKEFVCIWKAYTTGTSPDAVIFSSYGIKPQGVDFSAPIHCKEVNYKKGELEMELEELEIRTTYQFQTKK